LDLANKEDLELGSTISDESVLEKGGTVNDEGERELSGSIGNKGDLKLGRTCSNERNWRDFMSWVGVWLRILSRPLYYSKIPTGMEIKLELKYCIKS